MPLQSRAYAQRAVSQPRNVQPKGDLPLRLTASLISQQYCEGDAQLDSIEMRVKLTFTNLSPLRRILYKGSDYISRIAISRNAEDAAARQFEVNSSVTQVTGGPATGFRGASPNRDFVVIPAGGAYELKTTVTVLAVRGDAREIAGAVTSGKHVLQLEVLTWPHSMAAAEESFRRWQQIGYLWYSPLTSAPMAFTIEKQRKVTACQ